MARNNNPTTGTFFQPTAAVRESVWERGRERERERKRGARERERDTEQESKRERERESEKYVQIYIYRESDQDRGLALLRGEEQQPHHWDVLPAHRRGEREGV